VQNVFRYSEPFYAWLTSVTNGQTDGRTDRRTEPALAIASSNWSDVHDKFTTDVALDKKVLITFLNSSGSGIWMVCALWVLFLLLLLLLFYTGRESRDLKNYEKSVKLERPLIRVIIEPNKKLIRRWDSERELSLRRHRARTTKYNRLVHKFRHRSTWLCVGTHVFTKFSELTQYNGHYVVQGHSRSPILVPIESSYTTSY